MFTTLCTQCGATVLEHNAQKYDRIKGMQLTYGDVEYQFVYLSHRCLTNRDEVATTTPSVVRCPYDKLTT